MNLDELPAHSPALMSAACKADLPLSPGGSAGCPPSSPSPGSDPSAACWSPHCSGSRLEADMRQAFLSSPASLLMRSNPCQAKTMNSS